MDLMRYQETCVFLEYQKKNISFLKNLYQRLKIQNHFDIGVGIGMFSLFAKRINPKIKVWSIEPNPAI